MTHRGYFLYWVFVFPFICNMLFSFDMYSDAYTSSLDELLSPTACLVSRAHFVGKLHPAAFLLILRPNSISWVSRNG